MLNKDEYNAMLHAIWQIDRNLKLPDLTDFDKLMLNRDRQALSDIFNRLTSN